MTEREVFTSTLMIHSSDKSLEYELVETSKEIEEYIDKTFNVFNPESKARKQGYGFNLEKEFDFITRISCRDAIIDIIKKYNGVKTFGYFDTTCCLKGLFITLVLDKVFMSSSTDYFYSSFIMNFGGDMFGYNFSEPVQIEGCNLKFLPPKTFGWACLTSGNFGRRGEHITPTNGYVIENKSLTLAGSASLTDMAYLDALTTYLYSGGTEYKSSLSKIWVDKDGNPSIEVR